MKTIHLSYHNGDHYNSVVAIDAIPTEPNKNTHQKKEKKNQKPKLNRKDSIEEEKKEEVKIEDDNDPIEEIENQEELKNGIENENKNIINPISEIELEYNEEIIPSISEKDLLFEENKEEINVQKEILSLNDENMTHGVCN